MEQINLLITIILIFIIIYLSILIIKNSKIMKLKSNELQEKSTEILLLNQELIQLNKDNSLKENKIEDLNKEIKTINTINTEHTNEIATLKTKLEIQQNQIDDENQKLKINFKNLANEILENNSQKLTEQNKQHIGTILQPVQTQLNEFRKKVEDIYDKEAKDRNFLSAELKSLKELNLKISTDAINLTNALKGEKKKQGIWGEMVLEKVLENSGLREGYEFVRECYLKDEAGVAFRPDVIVNLPDNRHIIIDAKTSLNNYNEYIASNDDVKEIYVKKHINAIKEHIKSLASKQYENLQGINSLDFIFMFIPIEGALLLALEEDINLYDEAFKQKIILVSPTTLLVALRAVENTWRYEKQSQSIADVAKRAELLYNKFNGFVEDMEKVNETLQKATLTQKKAYDKLSHGSGNLISQVTMLKQVSNIKPKKEIKNILVQTALENNDEL